MPLISMLMVGTLGLTTIATVVTNHFRATFNNCKSPHSPERIQLFLTALEELYLLLARYDQNPMAVTKEELLRVHIFAQIIDNVVRKYEACYFTAEEECDDLVYHLGRVDKYDRLPAEKTFAGKAERIKKYLSRSMESSFSSTPIFINQDKWVFNVIMDAFEKDGQYLIPREKRSPSFIETEITRFLQEEIYTPKQFLVLTQQLPQPEVNVIVNRVLGDQKIFDKLFEDDKSGEKFAFFKSLAPQVEAPNAETARPK